MAVRRAHDGELRACRMLLPEAFFPSRMADIFVAVDESERELVGAAAVAWLPGGFPMLVHIPAPYRRRGIGRRLVEAIAAACAGEAACLRNWTAVSANSEAAAFLTASGFDVTRRFLAFETDAQHSHALIAPRCDLLRRRGAIPADARIVDVDDVPRDAVAGLVASELGALPGRVSTQLALDGPAGFSRETSVALRVGDTLGGVLLSQCQDGIGRMDVRVVAPDYRRGWANAMLLEAAIRRCLHQGARRLRFMSDENTHDTVKLARRAGVGPQVAGLVLERRL